MSKDSLGTYGTRCRCFECRVREGRQEDNLQVGEPKAQLDNRLLFLLVHRGRKLWFSREYAGVGKRQALGSRNCKGDDEG
jgi:hypothetical protein